MTSAMRASQPANGNLGLLEETRLRTLTQKDFGVLAELCHPDLRYTHSTGFTDTCESYLTRCRSGFYTYDTINYQLHNVIRAAGAVLFEETMNAEVKVNGQPRSLRTKALAVWVQVDGIWRFIAYLATAT